MKHAKVSFLCFSHIGAINRVKDVLSRRKSEDSADPDYVVGLEVMLLRYSYLGRGCERY